MFVNLVRLLCYTYMYFEKEKATTRNNVRKQIEKVLYLLTALGPQGLGRTSETQLESIIMYEYIYIYIYILSLFNTFANLGLKKGRSCFVQ